MTTQDFALKPFVLLLAFLRVACASEIRCETLSPVTTADVKRLVDVLATSSSPQDRIGALQELAGIGRPAAQAVPAIASFLRDQDPQLRGAAAIAIGAIATDRKEYFIEIERLISDDDPLVRTAACHSAWKLGRSCRAVQSAIEMLRNRDPVARAEAAEIATAHK